MRLQATQIVLLVYLCCECCDARVWTSQTGTQLEAEHVETKSGVVRLRKKDGQLLTISLRELSKEDQAYLKLQETLADIHPALNIVKSSETKYFQDYEALTDWLNKCVEIKWEDLADSEYRQAGIPIRTSGKIAILESLGWDVKERDALGRIRCRALLLRGMNAVEKQLLERWYTWLEDEENYVIEEFIRSAATGRLEPTGVFIWLTGRFPLDRETRKRRWKLNKKAIEIDLSRSSHNDPISGESTALELDVSKLHSVDDLKAVFNSMEPLYKKYSVHFVYYSDWSDGVVGREQSTVRGVR